MVVTGEIEKYTKKEQVTVKKQIEKMDKYLIGLTDLERIPDALYIAYLLIEKTAAAEATRTKVSMVAVCDSNVDPTKVQYPIPANDDAVNSIKMIVDLFAGAINEGKADFEKNKLQAPVKAKEFSSEEKTSFVEEKRPAKPAIVKKERRALRKEEAV